MFYHVLLYDVDIIAWWKPGCLSVQVWSPGDAEDEVLVMVCRTGLNTTMGKTIRELLAPTKVCAEDNPVAVVRLSAVRWQSLVPGSSQSSAW